jgi:tetratricopeptide (TPR) repeat protein
VNKSLVLQSEQEDGEARFSMLETIQEFAHEKLDMSAEVDAVRSRHAHYYLELAEAAEPELMGAEQAAWLTRLERDHDNLRAALAWALEAGVAEIAARICAAVWRFWWVHGHLVDGREWLEKTLGAGGLPEGLRARVLNAAGGLAYNQGDPERAVELFEEALALERLAGNELATSRLLRNLGLSHHECGDHARATALLEEALAISRRSDDRRGLALALESLAIMTFYAGDYERARPLHEESLDLYRELGDRHSQAIALNNLGCLARYQGDLARAAALLEEGRELSRALASKDMDAGLLSNLGDVARDSGEPGLARSRYEEALKVAAELGLRRQVAITVSGLAELAAVEGRLDEAARLYAIVAGLRESSPYKMPPEEERAFESQLAAARRRLGEGAFASAKEGVQALSVEQLVSLATEAVAAV